MRRDVQSHPNGPVARRRPETRSQAEHRMERRHDGVARLLFDLGAPRVHCHVEGAERGPEQDEAHPEGPDGRPSGEDPEGQDVGARDAPAEAARPEPVRKAPCKRERRNGAQGEAEQKKPEPPLRKLETIDIGRDPRGPDPEQASGQKEHQGDGSARGAHVGTDLPKQHGVPSMTDGLAASPQTCSDITMERATSHRRPGSPGRPSRSRGAGHGRAKAAAGPRECWTAAGWHP